MDFKNMVKSEDYLINLGRFIENLTIALQYHKSWKDISDVEERFDLENDTTLIIELVPAWADLESLEGQDALDLFNEYYDSDYKDAARVNWYNMDIKIRVLDYRTGIEDTYKVYYFDKGELKSL